MKILLLSLFVLTPLLRAQDSLAVDTQQRIQKIVFPSLSLKERTLEQTIELLQKKSIELDGDPDPTKRGVTFVLVPQNSADTGAGGLQTTAAKINYDGSKVTLSTVLREIFSPTYEVYVTSVGIVICPKGTEPFPNPKASTGEILEKIS